MTPSKKGESALGRGLDALIRKDGNAKSKGKPREKSALRNIDSAKEKLKVKKVVKTQDDPNKIIIEGVVLEVRKNPRISLWSAKSAAVLRFLKNTKPAFSISKEASVLIEEAVQQKYPEIWEMFEDMDF